MQPTVKLTGVSHEVKLLSAIKDLAKMQVYVGIPEKNASRKGAGITNAALAFIHTHGVRSTDVRRRVGAMMLNRKLTYEGAMALYVHTVGSPMMAIPPRPIIEPAIEAKGNKERIAEHLKVAGKAVLDGSKTEALNELRKTGMVAQNLCRAWFTDPRNNWAPNAPATIRRKKSSRPLIDTGQLRASITYVIAEE